MNDTRCSVSSTLPHDGRAWIGTAGYPRRAVPMNDEAPTVATTTWGIKQIQLMLLHDRQEIRETLGGGERSPSSCRR